VGSGQGHIFFTYADAMPLLPQLHLLKRISGKVVNVRQSVCAQWKDVAIQLSFTPGLIGIISENDGPEKAFDDKMTRWLNGTEGTRQPMTWRTLLAVFRDIGHGVLASDLESIIPETDTT